MSNGYVRGGYSDSGTASGNTVSISDGDCDTRIMNDVTGGASYSSSTDNSVTVSGGTISGRVYGGSSSCDDASGNSVTVSGGTISSYVYGGYSSDGNASGNSIIISGGTISHSVYGNYSASGTATSIPDMKQP